MMVTEEMERQAGAESKDIQKTKQQQQKTNMQYLAPDWDGWKLELESEWNLGNKAL